MLIVDDEESTASSLDPRYMYSLVVCASSRVPARKMSEAVLKRWRIIGSCLYHPYKLLLLDIYA